MILRRETIPNLCRALCKLAGSLFANSERMLASDDVREIRQTRCIHCPHYVKDSHQCDICTCVVNLKVMFAAESCPVGRWGRQTKRSAGL